MMDIREKDIKKIQWGNLLKWVEDIPMVDDSDSESFNLYPLQLANAIRITCNNAVFIFDEVGCGKTISSGIMAKTYLSQNPGKKNEDILVITTNTIKGQFGKDLEKIDKKLKPIIYNNLVGSDLRYLNKEKKWGLVIIDEAHEFSNLDTERYKKLKNDLRSEKVVFLTATPLRGGGSFAFYKDLANAILEKNDEYKEITELDNTVDVENPEDNLICAKFDPQYPITRYFKDTMKYLEIHGRREKAHRVIPELWYSKGGETREQTLAREIKEKIDENGDSKFVIFVRFKKEAESLKKELCQNLGECHKVVTVFADEKYQLENYKGDTKDLPTVLILNYQIGEAGVNLPGYNYVVHWHISSDPVRLEQRYGRIDRLNSRHNKIYSCFVVPKEYDSNSRNLNSAIYYTMGELLTKLPARNVLLTKDTLSFYKNNYERSMQKYKEDLEVLKSIDIDTYSDDKIKQLFDEAKEAGIDNVSGNKNDPLYVFLLDKGDKINWNEGNDGVETLKICIQDEIMRQKRGLERRINSNKDKEDLGSFDEKIKFIEEKSDQIFYLTKPNDLTSLNTIDSQETLDKKQKGCANRIVESEDYRLLESIVKQKNAVREVLHYADEDTLFAAEIFFKIGDIHSFTDELPKEMNPEFLAYKYKR